MSKFEREDPDQNNYLFTLIHELKSPIREISLYAEFIEEDNRERLAKQSVEDLHAIRRVCDQTQDMIKRLMEYNNAGYKNLESARIDVKEMTLSCFRDLKASQPERDIRLTVEELPDIVADPVLIRLMIRNILSNSIKFTREKDHAEIRIYSKIKKDHFTLIFQDNGIGFDMMNARKIFLPFYRLQGDERYEGNGLGLAIVRRTAERYGGEADIQGGLGKGCEVKIRLPLPLLHVDVKTKHDTGKIRIGIIGDLTGKAGKEEQGKYYAYHLAAEEINSTGGILGKQIEITYIDDRSDAAKTREAAEYLTQTLDVDVLMGSTLSPSRDIMRQAAYRTQTLYIDTQQTEGGVCNHYTFCVSAEPEQQLRAMLCYLIELYGEKCYIIAADYNYGILSAEWAKALIREYGGIVVGMEYLDENITDFDPVIDRIEQLQTDVLVSFCVFPNHDNFYRQWNARGMNRIPNATTQVAAEFIQHVELELPIMENTYVMASFLEELGTEAAQNYVRKYRRRYNREQVAYMGMDVETVYTAMYLYKAAVEMAGTTETEAVIERLESGKVYFDGPGGRVTVRGEDHQTIRTLSCFRIDAEHHLKELFCTNPTWSDYIEQMVEKTMGVKGGIRKLGINAGNIQFNMLLDKIQ